jgi:DNA-binding NtrC family response regulator
MPELDGLAVAEELSINRNVSVILISGHADLKHAVLTREPVAAFLKKPFILEQLDVAIRSLRKS